MNVFVLCIELEKKAFLRKMNSVKYIRFGNEMSWHKMGAL